MLGLINYYRKFIPKCAKIEIPLRKLVLKNTRFVWSNEAQDVLNKLKSILSNSPVLVIAYFDKQCYLFVHNNSNFAVAAVLTRLGLEGQYLPVCFYSKKLTKCQCSYTITDKRKVYLSYI